MRLHCLPIPCLDRERGMVRNGDPLRRDMAMTPGQEVAWNLLSLSTTSAMLCLEMSLLGFLLQENYVSGLDSLARTFTIAGFAVSFDALLKAVYIFGFGIPMFDDGHNTTHPVKWRLSVILSCHP